MPFSFGECNSNRVVHADARAFPYFSSVWGESINIWRVELSVQKSACLRIALCPASNPRPRRCQFVCNRDTAYIHIYTKTLVYIHIYTQSAVDIFRHTKPKLYTCTHLALADEQCVRVRMGLSPRAVMFINRVYR